MKSTIKIAAALALSLPLTMVGCTCGQQESPDQVVPMEEPAAPTEGMEGMEEGAPAEEGMAPADPAEGTEGTATEGAGEGLEEGHTEGDGHEH